MKHPDPEEMNDGVLDHRGETLPYLSKSCLLYTSDAADE